MLGEKPGIHRWARQDRRSPEHNLEWIIFEERLDFIVVEIVGGHHAILAIHLEEDDRRHQGAGKVPGVALGEGKFL
jgi:hypothetical protein